MTMLANNLSSFFPETPDPPDSKVQEISAALDAALLLHVQTTFVPAGLGATFLSGLSTPTPFMILLASHLDATISPILSTALSLETNPSSPIPHLLAWGNVQPSFDALIPSTPSFMAGPQGATFWQVILFTIRFFIVPEFPEPEAPLPEEPESRDGSIIIEGEI